MLKSKAVMMAEAFLFGATRGDWALSANVAGYAQLPERTNIHIAKALVALQGKAEQVELVENIEKTKGAINWEEAAEEISPVLVQIATGELRANPAQQRAIEAIIIRGQGKVVEKQKKLVSPGIVVLPTLQTERENAQVCSICLGELET